MIFYTFKWIEFSIFGFNLHLHNFFVKKSTYPYPSFLKNEDRNIHVYV